MHTVSACRRLSRLLVAITALVVVGGLSATAAQAQTLDVPLKWTYKGAVYLRSYPGDASCPAIYTVPAGQTLRLTDFMLVNYSSTSRALPYQYLCTGTSGCSSALTAYVTAPVGSTLVNNTTTGYRVDAGQSLYACNYGGSGDYAGWSLSGYLYTNP